ncbi:MAG: flagellar biosynthesis protein FlhB [Bdellovibrionales bacterium]|nr:flagellar biosynthesis protein FlhB [Bdellovibrionales bacterium]
MSEHSTPEERTELPTERRMGQLRKDGAVHQSNEVAQVSALLSGFLCLFYLAGWLIDDMKTYLVDIFQDIARPHHFTELSAFEYAEDAFIRFAPEVALLSIIVATVATLAVMLQTKWNVKQKKIHFRWSTLNPVSGIKKIFSIDGAVKTLKALFKLCLILPLGYFALKNYAPGMVQLMHTTVPSIMEFIAEAIQDLFWDIFLILFLFAVFDYFWSRYQWFRQNKMTKEEVKDEKKAIEGDEATKRKIVAKGLQRIMQRIQNSVPQADVVITNPTHFAVALKYDRDEMAAPRVVAKGKGFLALRIRAIAKEANVPILERKPLARALYASVEVGAEIPRELFKAVAEVLAYVYKLKNPWGHRRQSGA